MKWLHINYYYKINHLRLCHSKIGNVNKFFILSSRDVQVEEYEAIDRDLEVVKEFDQEEEELVLLDGA